MIPTKDGMKACLFNKDIVLEKNLNHVEEILLLENFEN